MLVCTKRSSRIAEDSELSSSLLVIYRYRAYHFISFISGSYLQPGHLGCLNFWWGTKHLCKDWFVLNKKVDSELSSSLLTTSISNSSLFLPFSLEIVWADINRFYKGNKPSFCGTSFLDTASNLHLVGFDRLGDFGLPQDRRVLQVLYLLVRVSVSNRQVGYLTCINAC